jgi:hypothetical protein
MYGVVGTTHSPMVGLLLLVLSSHVDLVADPIACSPLGLLGEVSPVLPTFFGIFPSCGSSQ